MTPYLGEVAHFQPGPDNSMGHDDLKVIEAKFLVAVTGGERRSSTVDDVHDVAEAIAAAASAELGTWQQVPAAPNATFGGDLATPATAD